MFSRWFEIAADRSGIVECIAVERIPSLTGTYCEYLFLWQCQGSRPSVLRIQGGTRQVGRRLCGAFQAVKRSRDPSMAWICWHGPDDASHGDRSGRRALYDDPNLLTLSGKTIPTAEAAERYGISDLDGYEPKSLRGIYGPHPDFDIQ